MADEARQEIMRLQSIVREASKIFDLLESGEITVEEAVERWND